jgi:hypothetical protein
VRSRPVAKLAPNYVDGSGAEFSRYDLAHDPEPTYILRTYIRLDGSPLTCITGCLISSPCMCKLIKVNSRYSKSYLTADLLVS